MTEEIKRNTFNLIMTCMSQLNKAQQETGLWQALDIKEAAILHKYMTAAGSQIRKGDECKYFYQLSQHTSTLAINLLLCIALHHRDDELGCTTDARQNAHQDDRALWQRCCP